MARLTKRTLTAILHDTVLRLWAFEETLEQEDKGRDTIPSNLKRDRRTKYYFPWRLDLPIGGWRNPVIRCTRLVTTGRGEKKKTKNEREREEELLILSSLLLSSLLSSPDPVSQDTSTLSKLVAELTTHLRFYYRFPIYCFINSSVHRWFWFRRLLFPLWFVRLSSSRSSVYQWAFRLSLRIYCSEADYFIGFVGYGYGAIVLTCLRFLAMPTVCRFWFSTLCVIPMCHGSFHLYIFNVCVFV